ncbi:MAG: hypothetical protein ACLT5B_09835 [Clostridia bacterium]
MNYFKDYVENPVKLGMICIIEIVMSWWVNKFKHSPEIISIKQQRLGALREAFKIVQVDGYYFHLFLGLFWAISLLFLIFWGIKERKYIASLIYIVFLIIFWGIFWDPIVTTFLTILIAGSLIVLSMDS